MRLGFVKMYYTKKSFTVRMESDGIYFIRITAGDEAITRKMVVER